jgi:gluconate 2-dehydrogenase gamma chain
MKETAASRRQFLVGSATGLSAAWLELRWPSILAAAAHARQAAGSGRATFEFFSSEQATEVEAMAAQIIPSNETSGARDAHVIYFIDRALASFDRDKQKPYLQGLQDLAINVRKQFPRGRWFSDLSSEQQIQILATMEHSEFFELVRLHTIMGFLANPNYGGNRDEAGWKAIGFENRMFFDPPFGYYDEEYRKEQDR